MTSITRNGAGIVTLLSIALFIQFGKRLGFSKQIVRYSTKLLLSSKNKERAFTGYEPTQHDVFIATFGKSGTNWMMQIGQQIAHKGESEFKHIHDVAAWPDAPGLASTGVSLTDPTPHEQSPTGLRVIKTHLETEFVPYNEEATYLTVLRDPNEVLVSSYYFIGGMLGVLKYVSIDDWFNIFIAPGSMATSWARHTAGFWDWRNRPNTLVLNYREIKMAPRATIKCIAEIMGVALSGSELTRVIERSSFDYMKKHEYQFAPPVPPFMKKSDRPLMIRRGESGGSGELLSPDQRATVDRICQAELRRLGSDFPYTSAFCVESDAA